MLGSIEERFLGGEELGDTCRADFHAELLGLSDKNADLAYTFQFGVAFHHAGWPSVSTLHQMQLLLLSFETEYRICMLSKG